jgi:hypothetical protein
MQLGLPGCAAREIQGNFAELAAQLSGQSERFGKPSCVPARNDAGSAAKLSLLGQASRFVRRDA